ncbi:DUF3099 domain-containing protein [Nocardioides terrisoli]|uniref:DUF3099 domain-containing protein n=1 Tax=Nocardioides terrisoli TaxID=3388267 RepID=UPI00287BADA2|nr:DUF3099 domain-containing protein [Nocardioides marmorisolisilvae]
MARDRRHEEVARITTAAESPKADIDHREKRYIISMTIRTLCFIGAVFARHIPWLCGILIVASFLLPYVAVVMANRASPILPGDPFEGPDHKEIE